MIGFSTKISTFSKKIIKFWDKILGITVINGISRDIYLRNTPRSDTKMNKKFFFWELSEKTHHAPQIAGTMPHKMTVFIFNL